MVWRRGGAAGERCGSSARGARRRRRDRRHDPLRPRHAPRQHPSAPGDVADLGHAGDRRLLFPARGRRFLEPDHGRGAGRAHQPHLRARDPPGNRRPGRRRLGRDRHRRRRGGRVDPRGGPDRRHRLRDRRRPDRGRDDDPQDLPRPGLRDPRHVRLRERERRPRRGLGRRARRRPAALPDLLLPGQRRDRGPDPAGGVRRWPAARARPRPPSGCRPACAADELPQDSWSRLAWMSPSCSAIHFSGSRSRTISRRRSARRRRSSAPIVSAR